MKKHLLDILLRNLKDLPERTLDDSRDSYFLAFYHSLRKKLDESIAFKNAHLSEINTMHLPALANSDVHFLFIANNENQFVAKIEVDDFSNSNTQSLLISAVYTQQEWNELSERISQALSPQDLTTWLATLVDFRDKELEN